MGTAPRDQQHPAMPHPKLVVRRSRAMLRQLGFTDADALITIINSATMARMGGNVNRPDRAMWLSDVISEAEARLAAHLPSVTDHTGDDYGDGPGRQPGGPEENRQ